MTLEDLTAEGTTPRTRAWQAAAAEDSALVLALKMAAPYIAVAVFWLWFHNGWLAILAYHAQILLWSRGRLPGLVKPRWTPLTLLIIPSALAGLVLYALLPYVVGAGLGSWLTRAGLSGTSWMLMVAYFGVVHPVLEQVHWAPLRERTPVAHVAFAGYHMLVLYSLLALPWLAACFVVLLTASVMWHMMTRASGSIIPAVASHIAADLGIAVAAFFSTR